MKDENIRRMLHLSRMERERAVLIESATSDEARNKSLRHFAVLMRSNIPSLDKALQQSLLPLGTQALWVDNSMKIYGNLRTIYESTGSHWSDVS